MESSGDTDLDEGLQVQVAQTLPTDKPAPILTQKHQQHDQQQEQQHLQKLQQQQQQPPQPPEITTPLAATTSFSKLPQPIRTQKRSPSLPSVVRQKQTLHGNIPQPKKQKTDSDLIVKLSRDKKMSHVLTEPDFSLEMSRNQTDADLAMELSQEKSDSVRFLEKSQEKSDSMRLVQARNLTGADYAIEIAQQYDSFHALGTSQEKSESTLLLEMSQTMTESDFMEKSRAKTDTDFVKKKSGRKKSSDHSVETSRPKTDTDLLSKHPYPKTFADIKLEMSRLKEQYQQRQREREREIEITKQRTTHDPAVSNKADNEDVQELAWHQQITDAAMEDTKENLQDTVADLVPLISETSAMESEHKRSRSDKRPTRTARRRSRIPVRSPSHSPTKPQMATSLALKQVSTQVQDKPQKLSTTSGTVDAQMRSVKDGIPKEVKPILAQRQSYSKFFKTTRTTFSSFKNQSRMTPSKPRMVKEQKPSPPHKQASPNYRRRAKTFPSNLTDTKFLSTLPSAMPETNLGDFSMDIDTGFLLQGRDENVELGLSSPDHCTSDVVQGESSSAEESSPQSRLMWGEDPGLPSQSKTNEKKTREEAMKALRDTFSVIKHKQKSTTKPTRLMFHTEQRAGKRQIKPVLKKGAEEENLRQHQHQNINVEVSKLPGPTSGQKIIISKPWLQNEKLSPDFHEEDSHIKMTRGEKSTKFSNETPYQRDSKQRQIKRQSSTSPAKKKDSPGSSHTPVSRIPQKTWSPGFTNLQNASAKSSPSRGTYKSQKPLPASKSNISPSLKAKKSNIKTGKWEQDKKTRPTKEPGRSTTQRKQSSEEEDAFNKSVEHGHGEILAKKKQSQSGPRKTLRRLTQFTKTSQRVPTGSSRSPESKSKLPVRSISPEGNARSRSSSGRRSPLHNRWGGNVVEKQPEKMKPKATLKLAKRYTLVRNKSPTARVHFDIEEHSDKSLSQDLSHKVQHGERSGTASDTSYDEVLEDDSSAKAKIPSKSPPIAPCHISKDKGKKDKSALRKIRDPKTDKKDQTKKDGHASTAPKKKPETDLSKKTKQVPEVCDSRKHVSEECRKRVLSHYNEISGLEESSPDFSPEPAFTQEDKIAEFFGQQQVKSNLTAEEVRSQPGSESSKAKNEKETRKQYSSKQFMTKRDYSREDILYDDTDEKNTEEVSRIYHKCSSSKDRKSSEILDENASDISVYDYNDIDTVAVDERDDEKPRDRNYRYDDKESTLDSDSPKFRGEPLRHSTPLPKVQKVDADAHWNKSESNVSIHASKQRSKADAKRMDNRIKASNVKLKFQRQTGQESRYEEHSDVRSPSAESLPQDRSVSKPKTSDSSPPGLYEASTGEQSSPGEQGRPDINDYTKTDLENMETSGGERQSIPLPEDILDDDASPLVDAETNRIMEAEMEELLIQLYRSEYRIALRVAALQKSIKLLRASVYAPLPPVMMAPPVQNQYRWEGTLLDYLWLLTFMIVQLFVQYFLVRR